jgi:hypothetical protein
MQQEIEAINQRGAFFSGGATQYTTGLQEQHARDISSLALQAQAADFQNLAQQAGLTAEQTQYITNQLYSNQASAYERAWNQYTQEYAMYQDAQQLAEQRRQFEANLAFDKLRYASDLGLKKSQAKSDYAATMAKIAADQAEYSDKSRIQQYQYDTSQAQTEAEFRWKQQYEQAQLEEKRKKREEDNWWEKV